MRGRVSARVRVMCARARVHARSWRYGDGQQAQNRRDTPIRVSRATCKNSGFVCISPPCRAGYSHRPGRTGRAGSRGPTEPMVCEWFLKSPYAVSPPLKRVTQARTGAVGLAALGVGLRWYSAPTLCSGSRLHLPARGDTVMASPRRRGSPAGSKFGPGSQAEPPRASAFCQSNSVYVLPPRWEDYGYGPIGASSELHYGRRRCALEGRGGVALPGLPCRIG